MNENNDLCQDLWFRHLIYCCMSLLLVMLLTCLLDLTTSRLHSATTTVYSFRV